MKYLNVISIFIVNAVVVYILVMFILLEPDIRKMTIDERSTIVVITIISFLISWGVYQIRLDTKNKKK